MAERVEIKMWWETKNHLEYREGLLHIGKISTKKLAKKYGTPLYVMNENRIRDNYRRLKNAFESYYEKLRIYYACKANSNLSVLKILKNEGAFADCVSPGEISLALKAGFPPERILFTGTSVGEENEFAYKKKVIINIDSLSQLERLSELGACKISIRLNPGVGAGHHGKVITGGRESKFGIWENDILKAYELALKYGLEPIGIQMHIGSGILDPRPYLLSLEKLMKIAYRVKKLGINFEFIDIGGGFGIPYKKNENPLDLEKFGKAVILRFKELLDRYNLGRPYLGIQPGRYIVGDVGILITKVNTIKKTPYHKFIGIDAGFNTLLRPAMYNSYHEIVPVNKKRGREKVIIAGPICEAGDVFGERKLQKIGENDLLAILNAGAYGFVMSSNYNLRPRAAEIIVRNGKADIVRERESIRDLEKGQRLPSWLK